MNIDHASTPCDELMQLLAHYGIAYDMAEHDAVGTIADALSVPPDVDGLRTRNVFLRDGRGERHFLLVVCHDAALNLPDLARQLGVSKLRLASPEHLLRCLGITPGAVSVFSLINDLSQTVELVFDERVAAAQRLQAHPLRTTATVSIARPQLDHFLRLTGHLPAVVAL